MTLFYLSNRLDCIGSMSLSRMCVCVCLRKEDQILLLETEMTQERQIVDNLVNDMVRFYCKVIFCGF